MELVLKALDPCLPLPLGTEATVVEQDEQIVVLDVKTEQPRYRTARYARLTLQRYWKPKHEKASLLSDASP